MALETEKGEVGAVVDGEGRIEGARCGGGVCACGVQLRLLLGWRRRRDGLEGRWAVARETVNGEVLLGFWRGG